MKNGKLNYCFLLVVSLLFFSCNFISFDNDEVFCIPGDSVSWYEGDYVVFKFSCEVEHYYAEESVVLKSGTSQYVTEKTWNGNELWVRPEEGWKKGRIYSVAMNGTQYKKGGAVFTAYVVSTFTYGNKEDLFKVIEYPECKKECDQNYLFVIKINKPVSKINFEESFSITPSVGFKIETDETKSEFTIRPENNWDYNTLYSWKIEKLVSIDEWELQQNITGTFETLQDLELPVLETICPVTGIEENSLWLENKKLDGNISSKMPVGFIFSKPMQYESVRNSISFTPDISGYLIQSDDEGKKFIYVPEKYYEVKKTYSLTVSTAAKDKTNKTLYKEHIETFLSSDNYLEIQSFKLDDELIADWKKSPVIHEIVDDKVSISISFSKSISEDNLNEVIDKVSFSLLFPLSSNAPVKTEVSWNDNKDTVNLTYSNLSKMTSDQITYYRLKIAGGINGINTGNGQYLEDEVCINIQPV